MQNKVEHDKIAFGDSMQVMNNKKKNLPIIYNKSCTKPCGTIILGLETTVCSDCNFTKMWEFNRQKRRKEKFERQLRTTV